MKEPKWIQANVALAINHELIRRFGGLDSGVRDENLFHSALERPRNKWRYGKPSPCQLAAAYCYAIISSHPFVDGNKRTAYQVAYTFLGLNGYDHNTDNADVFKTIMTAAAGKLSEKKLEHWFTQTTAKLKPAP